MQRPNFAGMAGFAIAAWVSMPLALGGDYYVDAVHGANTNAGTSAGEAWQTISHALTVVPDPTGSEQHVLHVAPGTYDTALGEVFPLRLRNRFELVGTSGSAVTILDGAGTGGELVRAEVGMARLEGFALRDAGIGVYAYAATTQVGLTLRELSITNMTGAGLFAVSALADVAIQAEHVRSNANGSGLEAFAGNMQQIRFTLVDSELSDNQGHGVRSRDNADLHFQRCRIVDNAADGINASASLFAGSRIDLEDTLVAGNHDHGIWATGDLEPSIVRVSLDRCTVVENGLIKGPGGAGLAVWYEAWLDLDSCLVFGNQDDLFDPSSVLSIAYCDVGDGDFAGSNGNFSLDPLFADPAVGDYRLSFGSPCAETGNPGWPGGVPDLAGTSRPVDGDLDTLERTDVGALELAPLFLRGTGAPGTQIQLELWGDSGALAAVYWTRGPLVPPRSTPFGELDLDRARMLLLFKRVAAPGPPTIWSRTLPNDPGLSGRTFSFQALVDSAAAPGGRAFTNPVVLTVP